MTEFSYIGRFAPSPTGPLHQGSLVAALASYLDARAHHGRWLLRIEDLDPPREVNGAAQHIIDTLRRFGFQHDGDIRFQSQRHKRYQAALDALLEQGWVYPCGCTRRQITQALEGAGIPIARHHLAVYPGTCRHGLSPGRAPRAWRAKLPESDAATIEWQDRNGDHHVEDLRVTTGDFVLKRADGLWAYQLAVVVDDGEQGVTDVVRGADLISSTSRQIYLQRLLRLPTPRYLHVPVVVDANGEKLSKQTGATAVDANDPLPALKLAMRQLNLVAPNVDSLDDFWARAIDLWARQRDLKPGSA